MRSYNSCWFAVNWMINVIINDRKSNSSVGIRRISHFSMHIMPTSWVLRNLRSHVSFSYYYIFVTTGASSMLLKTFTGAENKNKINDNVAKILYSAWSVPPSDYYLSSRTLFRHHSFVYLFLINYFKISAKYWIFTSIFYK